jgi:hypothetical protein
METSLLCRTTFNEESSDDVQECGMPMLRLKTSRRSCWEKCVCCLSFADSSLVDEEQLDVQEKVLELETNTMKIRGTWARSNLVELPPCAYALIVWL